MLKIFTLIHLLVNTTITPTSDGLYTLSTSDGCTYEYACKGEVLAYFEYGVFMYNDNLCECGELEWEYGAPYFPFRTKWGKQLHNFDTICIW